MDKFFPGNIDIHRWSRTNTTDSNLRELLNQREITKLDERIAKACVEYIKFIPEKGLNVIESKISDAPDFNIPGDLYDGAKGCTMCNYTIEEPYFFEFWNSPKMIHNCTTIFTPEQLAEILKADKTEK